MWSAIGGSHVSDRLPRPRASKHVIIRDEKSEGSYFVLRLQAVIRFYHNLLGSYFIHIMY